MSGSCWHGREAATVCPIPTPPLSSDDLLFPEETKTMKYLDAKELLQVSAGEGKAWLFRIDGKLDADRCPG